MTLLNSRSKFSIAKREAETTHSADIHDALQTESLSKLHGCLAASHPGPALLTRTEVSRMRGCSRLNSFAAPSGRSSVQGLLRIRLTRSSHANVLLSTALATTPFTDATAISTHRFACAATMRSSGPSET